ncbi:MAG: hypothetical protein E6Q97_33010 [Desulfurellales bacterium]|nr:MAG: hypothetical protein E6Q97_33010 [Desulfurellales bacterium]
MHELRVITHSGTTISYVAPQLSTLRKALRGLREVWGIEGYAFRDATGWSEADGKPVDRDTDLKAQVIWGSDHLP